MVRKNYGFEKLVFVNRVPGGETVCREGDRSDFVCFVVRGCLDIVKQNVEGGEVVIAHLRPGDSMGTGAGGSCWFRSATVKASKMPP